MSPKCMKAPRRKACTAELSLGIKPPIHSSAPSHPLNRRWYFSCPTLKSAGRTSSQSYSAHHFRIRHRVTRCIKCIYNVPEFQSPEEDDYSSQSNPTSAKNAKRNKRLLNGPSVAKNRQQVVNVQEHSDEEGEMFITQTPSLTKKKKSKRSNTFTTINAVIHTLHQQFRIQDPEYAVFLDLIRFIRPTQQQVDKMQDGIVLCPEGYLSDSQIWTAFQRHPNNTVMTVSERSAKDQHHRCSPPI